MMNKARASRRIDIEIRAAENAAAGYPDTWGADGWCMASGRRMAGARMDRRTPSKAEEWAGWLAFFASRGRMKRR